MTDHKPRPRRRRLRPRTWALILVAGILACFAWVAATNDGHSNLVCQGTGYRNAEFNCDITVTTLPSTPQRDPGNVLPGNETPT